MILTPEQIAKFADIANTAKEKHRGSYSPLFPYVTLLRKKNYSWEDIAKSLQEADINIGKQTIQSSYNATHKKQKKAASVAQ